VLIPSHLFFPFFYFPVFPPQFHWIWHWFSPRTPVFFPQSSHLTHNTNVQCRSPDGLSLLPNFFFYVRMSGPFNAVGISILSYFSPNIQLFFFF
jgi:hypothetical protein